MNYLHLDIQNVKKKTSIIDIYAKDHKNNVDYFIEMQVLKDKNRLNRTEFYNSKIGLA